MPGPITGGLFQPLDGDLTSIGGFNANGAWPYRVSTDTWAKVFMGSNMQFTGGVLNTVHFFSQLKASSDASVVAGPTLDLTGLVNGSQVDITGNTGITSILLEDGNELLVRFTGTPTITEGGALLTPGGESIPVTGGFATLRGGAGGTVTTVLTYQDSNDYRRETFDNIYMNDFANIGFSQLLSGAFTIGKDMTETTGGYLKLIKGTWPSVNSNELFAGSSKYSTYLKPGISGAVFTLPDVDGTAATLDGTETLTNKSIDASQLTGSIDAARIADGTLTFAKMAAAAWSDDVTMAGDSSILFPTQHAAKTYADNLKAGLKFKVDCRVASTANVSISSAPASIDGVTLASGDRVLLKNQTAGAENGSYIFNGAGAAMTRSTDGDTGAELISATFPIREGTANQDTWWTVTNDTITLGTTVLVISQTGGAGTYTNGSGLSLSGNSFSIATGGVSMAMLANLAGLSIIGRSANSTGVPAAITGTDGQVLRVSGTALGFGTIATAGMADGAVTLAKLDPAAFSNEDPGIEASDFILVTQSAITNFYSTLDGTLGYFNSPGGVTITTPILNGLPTGTGVASAATASTLAARDANANLTVNSLIEGYTTIATAAGTTTLLVGSPQVIYFTGSTTQICKLPVTSTLVLNQSYRIVNLSTGAVTVNSSGSNAIKILAAGTSAILTCILTSGTTAASWDCVYFGMSVATGKKGTISNSITFAGTDATTMTFPGTSATIARTDAANTFTGAQTVGSLISNAAIRLKGYTVATLPAGTQGDMAFATDLLTPAFLVAAVGGGAVVGPCFYNGAAWVAF